MQEKVIKVHSLKQLMSCLGAGQSPKQSGFAMASGSGFAMASGSGFAMASGSGFAMA